MIAYTCPGCGQPVAEGDLRYNGDPDHQWHADCHDLPERTAFSRQPGDERYVSSKRGRPALGLPRDMRCPDGFLSEGWRLVRKGGVVNFGRDRYQHDALKAYTGQYVLCEFIDGTGTSIWCFPAGRKHRDQPDGFLTLFPF